MFLRVSCADAVRAATLPSGVCVDVYGNHSAYCDSDSASVERSVSSFHSQGPVLTFNVKLPDGSYVSPSEVRVVSPLEATVCFALVRVYPYHGLDVACESCTIALQIALEL